MLSRLTRAQVRLVVGPSLTFLQNVCSVGLFATYPTSYEALVRRGKLKAGACLLHPTVTPTVLIVLACTLGEWLLVLAAAGGVGMAAIQIGKGTNRSTHFNLLLTSHVETWGFCTALGARVHRMCISFEVFVTRTAGGADFTIDYTKDGWQKEVLKITGGRGADLVYDPVGRIKGVSVFPLIIDIK